MVFHFNVDRRNYDFRPWLFLECCISPNDQRGCEARRHDQHREPFHVNCPSIGAKICDLSLVAVGNSLKVSVHFIKIVMNEFLPVIGMAKVMPLPP